ncbi:hypothetical protein [Halorarum salinum]|uniref:Uncharacterized protein n=1 Tax=Halorarum salinum TaxID=2743089 RepID=A0A7D5LBJ6_9EURY|nr:hypothetical protein [Halobaculum salinum]QLG62175.1 hypothetical protein HUG12_10690 [Halobaculum salinum]
MSLTVTETASVSTATGWIRGFWAFYRRYTRTAVHAIATAALTAFGLLVFIDPLFSVVAIGAYVFPPVVIFAARGDVEGTSEPSGATPLRTDSGRDAGSDADADDGDGDSDTDGDDGDSDSDGADADADADGSDADADGADADADG